MRFLSAVLVALLLACGGQAYAQSTVIQGGPVTGGHMPMYASSPQAVVIDSGQAGGGAPGANPSELGLVARGNGVPPYAGQGTGPNGENFCDYDAPTTNATGYHALCLSANDLGGGLVSYNAFGGASPLPLLFQINGALTGVVLGPSSTTIGDFACWNSSNGSLLADCGSGNTVLNTLLPSQVGNSGKFLSTNGTNTSWQAGGGGSSGLVVGTTTITGGSNGRIEYNNAGVLGELATNGAGNVVLDTSASLTGLTVVGSFTATGLVTNADLANSSVTIAGHSVALGGSQAIACADLSNGAAGCSTGTGTSGPVLPLLNGTNTWANAQTFSAAPVFSTLTGPLIGAAASPVTAGTFSGNTTTVATASGTLTNGHCVSIDGSGNFVDAGGACTTGGGGGTVNSGTAGQMTYYASTGTAVSGNANATISTGALTLGQGGSVLGQLKLANATSGVTTLSPAAVTANTLTLPAGTDTLVGKATTDTLTNKTISGASNTLSAIANASLTNSATTVNGQTCTLGSTCTVTAAATGITVGSTTITSGTNGNIEFNNAGVLGEKTPTGTGNVVLASSPTLVTPALGVPASVTLTNATGLPISTGVSGLGTGMATWLATPSSANLAAAVTDETGTGALAFATSPTLVTPILGTPTSGTLTNATGLPISTGVSGLGTGVATWLATPSSANLAAALTDETGTGVAVFSASPALTGSPTVPTQTAGDNSTKAASTAYVQTANTAVVGINTQTGTTYTFVLGDAGEVVEGNNASAQTYTVPPNSSVAYPIGTVINLSEIGAGQITFAPGSGVTIDSAGGALKMRAQFSTGTLYKRGTNEWVLGGDIST